MKRFYEPLEPRQLLAASVVNGVLTVTGTNNPEQIVLSDLGNGGVSVRIASTTTNHSGFNSIVINALDGDDAIQINAGVMGARIDAGPGADRVTGGNGNDTILGGTGNDYLEGKGGNDWLDGGTNRDTMHGNDGSDTVDYSSRTANLTISLDRVGNDGESGENDDVSDSLEQVICGSGNDRVTTVNTAPAANDNNYFWGNGGNDTLDAGNGNDSLDGGDGNDSLLGGVGNDYMDGWAGNDTMNGGDGDDSMLGWTGTDSMIGGPGNDWIVGEQDNDTLDGGIGNDALGGGDGDDQLRGSDGFDSLYGENGNDTLDGGNDSDLMEGGAGTDTADYSGRTHNMNISLDGVNNDGRAGSQLYFYDPFTGESFGDPGERDNVKPDIEVVLCGSGNDRVTARATDIVHNRFVGNGGNDTMNGGGGNDTLEGNSGHDNLAGGDGNDSLLGHDGNDTLGGDAGIDIMRGDIGDDTFWARDSAIDIVDGGTGNDRAKVDPNDTLTSIESFFEWLFGL